jgi:hypothetical protein
MASQPQLGGELPAAAWQSLPACLVESLKMERERSKKSPRERKARRSHGRERLCPRSHGREIE